MDVTFSTWRPHVLGSTIHVIEFTCFRLILTVEPPWLMGVKGRERLVSSHPFLPLKCLWRRFWATQFEAQWSSPIPSFLQHESIDSKGGEMTNTTSCIQLVAELRLDPVALMPRAEPHHPPFLIANLLPLIPQSLHKEPGPNTFYTHNYV